MEPLAVAYLRKSRDSKERADPDVLAKHRAILARLAADDGAPLPAERIFAEVRSGEHLAARPEFRRLLAFLAGLPPGSRPVLYCLDVDRLGRGIATERGIIQDALLAAGVTIRTPSGVIHLANPDETLLFEVKGSLARHELQKYKERVEMKRQQQVREGLILTGKAPWGYLWDRSSPGRGVLRPHPERFPVLQLMCREVLDTSIARLGARYGISPSTLQWTLRNPAICGWPARRHLPGHPETRRSTRPLPAAAWVWPEQPGDYQPACTRPEWERIQAVLDSRYTLRGKTGFDDNGWAKDVVAFLDCPGRARLGSTNRPPRMVYERVGPDGHRCTIDRAPVHAAVYTALLVVLARPEALLAALRRYQAARNPPNRFAAATTALAADLARRRAHLDRLNEERLDLADAEGRASNARVRDKIKGEIGRLSAALKRGAAGGESCMELDAVIDSLPALSTAFPALWQTLPGSEKRALVNAFIECVPVRIERSPRRRALRREVLPPVYRDWVLDLAD
jgi:DNA invertase Pin-like site-specific DNA recombinase